MSCSCSALQCWNYLTDCKEIPNVNTTTEGEDGDEGKGALKKEQHNDVKVINSELNGRLGNLRTIL